VDVSAMKRPTRQTLKDGRESMQIKESVAIVTGAGPGIGRALAESFAAAGARVLVGDIDTAGAQCTAERITARGHAVVAMRADASVDADIRAMIGLAATEFGPVDIYVANAGVGGPPGLGTSAHDWDHVLDVNVRAHIRAAAELVTGWSERGSGYFVSVASAAGLLTQIGAAGYAVSKHAAVGFAEWLAITYGDNGIGVSCVCPMGVNTALLNSWRDSPDASEYELAVSAITSAAEVIEPELVADMTVYAICNGRFLVVPHPQVLDLYRQKCNDYDRWIERMRRNQRSLASRGGSSR
jgi:NAD(P)-dependent dehydrogenase (short-subunit alcohol dehydrogenase family)